MTRLCLVLSVLILATFACSGPLQTQTATLVPPLPTEIPSTPIIPTQIPPTPIPPTPIPPTPIPPTEVPPISIPPTPIPPTEVSPIDIGQPEGYWGPGLASGTEILFQEDFSNPMLDWDENDSERVTRDFMNGEFVMKILVPDREGWSTIDDVVYEPDIVLDVDMRGSPNLPLDAVAGFVCGYEDNQNFYRMTVSADGQVDFVQKLDDEKITIYSSENSLSFNPVSSHLTGVCTQMELSLYVDWQLAATYPIDGLAAGSAGLLAGSNDTGNVELIFDNFIISEGPYMFADGIDAFAELRGNLLLSDDFSDENSGWDVRTMDEGGFTRYENGEYRMKVNKTEWDAWSNPNDFALKADVIVDVDVNFGTNPGDSQAGIICNYNMETHEDFVVATINGEGYPVIFEKIGGDNTFLLESEIPIELNPEVNHLSLQCVGFEVVFFVNGQLVGSTFTSVSEAGNVGLLAGTNDYGVADFSFDNFEIYSVR